MSTLQSINPATEDLLFEFPEDSLELINHKLEKASQSYTWWSNLALSKRKSLMYAFAGLLRQKRESLCSLIVEEIGVPIDQANSEIEKSAYIAEYFADNADEFLAIRSVQGVASKAQVVFEPLGVVLHVAPWNYPLYLALRPVITALIAGNTVVLKHASNVPRISIAIESLFRESGFEDAFQSLLIGSSKVEQVIRHPAVVMATVIGSERAGGAVASIAGEEIKKTLMELGGSDPFIVFEDANVEEAVEAATFSRLRNSGQSCNAAKRFIIMDSVFDTFVDQLKTSFEKIKVGDPFDTNTDMGPMATRKGRDEIAELVQDSLNQGAELITGGTMPLDKGYYYRPTILTHVHAGMRVNTEETFGPIAPVFRVQSIEEAITLANNSRYGLGASLWTQNTAKAIEIAAQIESGNVYINRMVRSDPRLPFGGIKKSGYGREFSDFGLLEFTNIKSIVVE